MKKWRFFPILVKEKIVAFMFTPDIISFAKCSKKCQNLLTSVPIHLPFILIDDRPYYIGRLNYNFLISLDDFSILATSQKLFFNQLKICVTTEKFKYDLKDLFKKLRESQKILKVKKLGMFFLGKFVELFMDILSICDPSSIEEIEIPELSSHEVYEEIVKTPQWKSCKRVKLNCKDRNRDCECCKVEMPRVNFDDFLHFERVKLEIQILDNRAKLVQNFRDASERVSFNSNCRKPIRQEIEKNGVGIWQRAQQYANTSFVIHPTKPDHVFYHKFDITTFTFSCGWTSADEFNSGSLFTLR